ncbi:MAG TPA: HEAT repeat domain-containing protein [Planctomycetota bacterium]
MRSLGHDELLHLSNAEFGFEESELVQVLMDLEGEWVVRVLGELALEEKDPLLKAILVTGLARSLSDERMDDPHLLPIVDRLFGALSQSSQDPWGAASDLATLAYGACLRGNGDYVALMSVHLGGSDNRMLLINGYLNMGGFPGAKETLAQVLTDHPSDAGRLGALEGLRSAALDGHVPPAELTALGWSALAGETDERNRLLLYEMMIAGGGEEALASLEQAWRSGELQELDKTAALLALSMDPARAQALFEDTLRERELDAATRAAIYGAMGAMEGPQGAEFLLGRVRDDSLPPEERLAGLRGLWNREIEASLAAELEGILSGSDDPAMRAEALRMLSQGETEGAGIDLRALAVLDDSPEVRAEAIQLAAVQPGPDTRAWLEERLQADDSYDVKATALAALVYHAHYAGDGDQVLGYLTRARKLTDDEQVLSMIAEGERMVNDYDPRNLELGLAQEAEAYELAGRLTDGVAARSFQRQARILSGMVAALRGVQPGRSASR